LYLPFLPCDHASQEVALLKSAGVPTDEELMTSPVVPMVIYRNARKGR